MKVKKEIQSNSCQCLLSFCALFNALNSIPTHFALPIPIPNVLNVLDTCLYFLGYHDKVYLYKNNGFNVW